MMENRHKWSWRVIENTFSVLCAVYAGYHMAVFISARMSSPSVDNCQHLVVVVVVEGSLVPSMCKTGPEGHYTVNH